MPSILSIPAKNLQISIPKNDGEVDRVLRRIEELSSERYMFNHMFDDIRKYVRPDVESFYHNETKGDDRHKNRFDGVASWSLDQFAGGLDGFITPGSDQWMTLLPQDKKLLRDYECLGYLEYVVDTIYRHYNNPTSNFNAVKHECYLDIGAFGTMVPYQEWNPQTNCLTFQAIPLAEVVIDQGADGRVDSVYRTFEWDERKVRQRFGDKTPSKMSEMAKGSSTRKFTIIHAVFPQKRYSNSPMRYRSLWIWKDERTVIDEGNYWSNPYHVARWKKLTGEVFGRSPAMDCLPDIKVLNEYEKLSLQAALLNVAPPLVAPHEGFLEPLNISPNAVNYANWSDGQVNPGRLLDQIDLRLSDAKMETKRNFIQQCFMVDVLRAFRKKERQSVPEIMQYQDEQLRAISPMTGRILSEFVEPMIRRSYQLLRVNGELPEPPTVLKGKPLDIVFQGQATMAQRRQKMSGSSRFLSTLMPIAQAKQDVLDIVNFDKLAEESAFAEGVPPSVLNSPEDIDKIRQARAQQQQMAQMQQMAQTGGDVAGAVKDLSVAGKNMPALIGYQ